MAGERTFLDLSLKRERESSLGFQCESKILGDGLSNRFSAVQMLRPSQKLNKLFQSAWTTVRSVPSGIGSGSFTTCSSFPDSWCWWTTATTWCLRLVEYFVTFRDSLHPKSSKSRTLRKRRRGSHQGKGRP